MACRECEGQCLCTWQGERQCRYGGCPWAAGEWTQEAGALEARMQGCINSQGEKARRGYKSWSSTAWPHAQAYEVNRSPWMCAACRIRVGRLSQADGGTQIALAGTATGAHSTAALDASTPLAAGVGGADVGLGGSASTSEVDDSSTQAVCLQLFQRNQQLVRQVEDLRRAAG